MWQDFTFRRRCRLGRGAKDTYDNGSQLRSSSNDLGIRDAFHLTQGMAQTQETGERGGGAEETVLYRYARTLILDV